jgi:hypothetical protein
MALFKRSKATPTVDGPDLSELLLEGQDMIDQLGDAHATRWGLGSADSWGLDQKTGILTWTFPHKTVTAPAQILGTHNQSAGSWLWAWANEGLLQRLRTDSERVKVWSEANQAQGLLSPKLDCDAETAATMAAIAFRITEATGFYRATAGASTLFMTFGPVTITTPEGSENFTINVS